MIKIGRNEAKKLIYDYLNGYSQVELSVKYSISAATVSRILNGVFYKDIVRPEELYKKLNDLRYYKNTHKLSLPSFTPFQESLILGSMLGDAWLEKPNGKWSDSKFKKQQKYLEPIRWLHDQLLPYTKNCKVYLVKRRSKIINLTKGKITHEKGNLKKSGYVVNTITHPIFTNLWQKWYIPGDKKYIKIVPKDITINPETLAMWFLDDGSNCPQKRQKHCTLCTQGFTKREVEFLSNILYTSFVLKSHVQPQTYNKNQFVLVLSGRSYYNLLDIIRPCIPWYCLSYKITV
jgi:hypothetical protein